MQSVSSRIWTRVAMSISYNDNDYTTGTSIPMIGICEIDIMFINIYRNPKTWNWFRYETFIHLFEFKGFSTCGERDTIFLCWWLLHRQPSNQPMLGARSAQICLASPSSEISTLPFGGSNSTNCYFSNPQILSLCFWYMTSFPTPEFISYLGFYFDICEWRILLVCVNTCTHVASN